MKFGQEASWNFTRLPSSKERNILLNTVHQQEITAAQWSWRLWYSAWLKGDVHYQIHSLVQGGVALLLPRVLTLEWLIQDTRAAMKQEFWALHEAVAPASLHGESGQDKILKQQYNLGQFFCYIMHHYLHYKYGRIIQRGTISGFYSSNIVMCHNSNTDWTATSN